MTLKFISPLIGESSKWLYVVKNLKKKKKKKKNF